MQGRSSTPLRIRTIPLFSSGCPASLRSGAKQPFSPAALLTLSGRATVERIRCEAERSLPMSACGAVQGRRDKRSIPTRDGAAVLSRARAKTTRFSRILIPRKFRIARLCQRLIEDFLCTSGASGSSYAVPSCLRGRPGSVAVRKSLCPLYPESIAGWRLGQSLGRSLALRTWIHRCSRSASSEALLQLTLRVAL